MGNCFNSCLPNQSGAARAFKTFNILDNESTAVDFTFLVEENASVTKEEKRDQFFNWLAVYEIPNCLDTVDCQNHNDFHLLGKPTLLLHFPSSFEKKAFLVSHYFILHRSCTSKDIQLQCLDARALLQRTATSTPASSLDLEWEHETLPISMVHDPSGSSWTALPEDLSCCPTTSNTHNNANASDSDWSRVSSANSLEWDNVQNSMHVDGGSPPVSELDTDTQILLGEIERLTSKTLEETGKELFS
ncbi:unnamed protein product [Psylliodes chrysocephalus]|uniref:Uncharacterized protein n=1 Tax=Psylliodes chrysocephalus TaxID=3402493 RepID=A0A9P0GA79_9CUCU|nr:unnamed protein product [Psylliodes chrysocephala]